MQNSRTRLNAPLIIKLSVCFLFCCFVKPSFAVQPYTPSTDGLANRAPESAAILKLKEIQSKVSAVARRNLETCVAINDGTGFGSGVVVSEDGLILTAGHVIMGDGPFTVTFPSGRNVKSKLLGRNLNDDTGMLQLLEPGPYPFVKINESPNFGSGQWVVSLGHSGGFELGRNPPIRSGRILSKKGSQLLTDAVLIGGDSGGPLFDLEGELIGIHSSIGDTIAENRHVMMSSFVRDWDRLKRGDTWGSLPNLNDPSEKKTKGKLGIRVDLEIPGTCVIKTVSKGKSADNAGLLPGDVIKQFDNVMIKDARHLIEVVKRKFAGDVCPIVIDRDGKRLNLEIMLR